MNLKEHISRTLKESREASGFTVYQVGDLLGKSGKTISAWENGRGEPDADTLLKLCGIYGIKDIRIFYPPMNEDAPLLLSNTESELLNLYRAVPPAIQEHTLSGRQSISNPNRRLIFKGKIFGFITPLPKKR